MNIRSFRLHFFIENAVCESSIPDSLLSEEISNGTSLGSSMTPTSASTKGTNQSLAPEHYNKDAFHYQTALDSYPPMHN